MFPTRLVAAAAAAAIAALPSCRRDAGPRDGRLDRYTVRGEVVRIEDAGGPRDLYVRHEAMPDFKDRTGAVVGMSPMVMPFRAGKDVGLDGIARGDKVRFRFSMDWQANRLEIESLEELPGETVLEFASSR